MKNRIGQKVTHFTESVIREMTRQAIIHGAVNLSQGFPDFPAPADIKQAASRAIDADLNQYPITWGTRNFRQAIANKTREHLGIEVDPEREIVVTCGSTEGMIASLLAIIDPGEEVIVFEPYYENYWPDSILSGAVIRYVTLYPPDGADRPGGPDGPDGADTGPGTTAGTPATSLPNAEWRFDRMSSAPPSTRRRRRSSSTRRTIRPARYSHAMNSA
jgi:hypothetical protein